MTRGARRALGSFVLLALLGPLVVDWLWTSDEERVIAALEGIERALEARDAEAVATWFSEEVEVGRQVPGFSAREPLVRQLGKKLEHVASLAIDRDETTIEFPEEGRARVKIGAAVAADFPGLGAGHFRVTVLAGMHRVPDGRFLFDSVEKVELGSLFR